MPRGFRPETGNPLHPHTSNQYPFKKTTELRNAHRNLVVVLASSLCWCYSADTDSTRSREEVFNIPETYMEAQDERDEDYSPLN